MAGQTAGGIRVVLEFFVSFFSRKKEKKKINVSVSVSLKSFLAFQHNLKSISFKNATDKLVRNSNNFETIRTSNLHKQTLAVGWPDKRPEAFV
jgi:hypothetical protein